MDEAAEILVLGDGFGEFVEVNDPDGSSVLLSVVEDDVGAFARAEVAFPAVVG